MEIIIKSLANNDQRTINYDFQQLNYDALSSQFVIPAFKDNAPQMINCPLHIKPIYFAFYGGRVEVIFERSEEVTIFEEWLKETDESARVGMRQWLIKVI